MTNALRYLGGLELLHPAWTIAAVHVLAATAAALLAWGFTPDREDA